MNSHARQKGKHNADIENSLRDQQFSEQRIENLRVNKMDTTLDNSSELLRPELNKSGGG